MRTVSVLCAATNSAYHGMRGVEVYDRRRDARAFGGSTPIVAHPPCRSWSAFTRHQAKPEPNEAELGLWCCEMLRACGGVLEQPAHSRLWQAAGLPLPGDRQRGPLWSLAVQQSWWGYSMKKGTWLAFCRVPAECVNVPFRLHVGDDRRTQQLMSRNQRAHTVPAFAQWLVAAARCVD